MTKPIAYLDYNATSPLRAEAVEAMQAAFGVPGNPSSVHHAGREARKLMESARDQVAALVGARSRDVVFMSGGTEANNAALRMTGAASLIISAVEHDCILAAAKASGLLCEIVPVDQDGVIKIEALRAALEKAPKPALVSVMLANNETGALQPVAEIVQIAKSFSARVHTDAVQAAGKIDIDMAALGVDYLSLSAHKLGGPKGVGALILASTAPLAPLVTGGGQELGRRSGTENVAGIAGFGAAALKSLTDLADLERQRALRDRIITEARAINPNFQVASEAVERLGNTLCLISPHMKGETQVMALDLDGVCVSSGSACSSGKVKVSHVLSAMGYSLDAAERSIRISLGFGTTDGDIDQLIGALKRTGRAKGRV